MHFPEKNLLRPPCDIRRYPFTGGADGDNSERRRDGRPNGNERHEVGEENQRQNRRGAPTRCGALGQFLSLRSLKSQVSEEICGRFGSFDGSTSGYRATRGNPMMWCQLHCLTVFGFRWKLKHIKQRLHQPSRLMRCAEVRTSRTVRKHFQLESLILAQNERWRQA
jgi:hypothetical protein